MLCLYSQPSSPDRRPPLKKPSKTILPELTEASRCAAEIIETLLQEMRRGVCEPARMSGEPWVKFFGEKQSVVVNIQKLVSALAALPTQEPRKDNNADVDQEVAILTPEEMKLLNAWLTEEYRPPKGN